MRSLTVTFAQAVTVAGSKAAAAFTLTRVSDGQVVSLAQAAATTNAGGRTVVTLTFTNGHQALVDQLSTGNGGPPSLADGVYRLTIDDAAVTVNGAAFDGDENGTPGGDYVSPLDGSGWGAPPTFYHFGLYRLFGDATGDRTVDLIDLSYFRTTFNAGLGDPLFLAYMDAENNNMVDLFDLPHPVQRQPLSVTEAVRFRTIALERRSIRVDRRMLDLYKYVHYTGTTVRKRPTRCRCAPAGAAERDNVAVCVAVPAGDRCKFGAGMSETCRFARRIAKTLGLFAHEIPRKSHSPPQRQPL